MDSQPWFKEFPAAITVCASDGTLLEMNERASQGYASSGGSDLVGTNILDCHPEAARAKLAALLASGQPNIYTIEKNGVKKLIYQSPWFQDGEVCGFVELALEIPFEMPHFVRSG